MFCPILKSYAQEIIDLNSLEDFCKNRSELESYLSENFAWRYIKMSCDNQNENLQKSYQQFVNEIMPNASVFDDAWNKKVIDSGLSDQVDTKGFSIMLRSIKNQLKFLGGKHTPVYRITKFRIPIWCINRSADGGNRWGGKDAPTSERLFRVDRSRYKRIRLPESCGQKTQYQR